MSDPFDRLDLLRGKFAEGFFNSTEQIAKMLMNGPLGELVNASVVRIIMNEDTIWPKGPVTGSAKTALFSVL